MEASTIHARPHDPNLTAGIADVEVEGAGPRGPRPAFYNFVSFSITRLPIRSIHTASERSASPIQRLLGSETRSARSVRYAWTVGLPRVILDEESEQLLSGTTSAELPRRSRVVPIFK